MTKPLSTEDYLKLSFLFEGNMNDKTIADNLTMYKGLSSEFQSLSTFGRLEPHKYDYKCFPIGSVLKSDRVSLWLL